MQNHRYGAVTLKPYLNLEAALINILFIMMMDQMALCNVKDEARSDEPTGIQNLSVALISTDCSVSP